MESNGLTSTPNRWRDQAEMPEFDAYHKWFGIRSSEQPPHHYRLLGIDLFETDADVIDSAAEQRMTFLQTCAEGQYVTESQTLLNEMSTARLCLLNSQAKAEYDAELTAQLEGASAPTGEGQDGPRVNVVGKTIRRPAKSGALIAVIGLVVVIGCVAVFMNNGEEPPVDENAKKPNLKSTVENSDKNSDTNQSSDIGKSKKNNNKNVASVESDTKKHQTVESNKPESESGKTKMRSVDGHTNEVASSTLPPDKSYTISTKPDVTIDVLKVIDAKRDSVLGIWNLEDGSLVSPEVDWALLEIPIDMPDEYRLRLVSSRVDGPRALSIGLVAGDSQFVIEFDRDGGKYSQLRMLKSDSNDPNGTAYFKPVFLGTEPSAIDIDVRKTGITVSRNDEAIITWTGDLQELSVPDGWVVRNKNYLFLGTSNCKYRLSKLEITNLSGVSAPIKKPIPDFEFTEVMKNRAPLVAKYGGTIESEIAVERGLKWLAQHQDANGSWSFDHTRADECAISCTRPGELKNCQMGATSMALLCFLGAGHTHKEGDYRGEVEKGIQYLGKNIVTSLAGANMMGTVEDNEGMYVQALATQCLAEAYRLTKDPQLRRPSQIAVEFIIAAQDPKTGGWRYKPREAGDTSVFGWQMQALHAGKLAHLKIRRNVFGGMTRFLNSVSVNKGARYSYLPKGPASAAMNAIGLLSRIYLGAKQDNMLLTRGMEIISKTGPVRGSTYYNFYATMATFQYGLEPWKSWNSVMRDRLVQDQAKNGHATGSWAVNDKNGKQGGRLYQTALSIWMLEVYYRHPRVYEQ